MFFKFSSEEACREVLEQNWFVNNDKPLILRKWQLGLKLEGFKMDFVPIWVTLTNIPSDLWMDEGLSSIASLVGKPLQMDFLTLMVINFTLPKSMWRLTLKGSYHERWK